LQQVSAKAFASASAIDPNSLPALLSALPRRRPRHKFGRVWVLHRRRVLLSTAMLVLAAGIGAVYEIRGEIAALSGQLYDLGQRELAHSELGISQISMTGQSITGEKDILAALGITPETSMVNFDVDSARTAIEALPAIESATIRKSYPNHLYISVVERVPVARWRLDGVTYVIDATGAKITSDGDALGKLPLVVGDEAGDDALVMIRATDAFPSVKAGLVALSRIGDRRWDMIYSTGLRVKLPEVGVAQALAQLSTLEQKFQVLERDVTTIDLRVPGVVAVKPSADAAAQLAAIAKATVAKNKVTFKQDADYSAPGH
jgi:cell division protein FtsQ